MVQKTYTFKSGETYALDQIYKLQGIIPNDAYDQDDISKSTHSNDNDCGETVRFTKNVTIKINISVKD